MTLEIVIGSSIGLVSLIGVLTNWSIVFIIWSKRDMRHPFSLLTVSLAVTDGVFSTLYLIYATPLTMFGIPFLADEQLSSVCGFVLMLCYVAATHSHTIITFNRLLSVFTPFAYRRIFSPGNTKLIILGNFCFAVALNLFFTQILECQCYYSTVYRAFTYTSLPVCVWYDRATGIYVLFGTSILNVTVDVVTMMKLKSVIEMQTKNRASTRSSKREMGYVKQSLAQATYLLFIFPWTQFTYQTVLKNPEYGFIITSLSWLAVHSLDGVFTFIFNGEVRRSLFRPSVNPTPSTISAIIPRKKSPQERIIAPRKGNEEM